MPNETAADRILSGLEAAPILDPHSHINPHSPTSENLADILGYHYYTELARSAGLAKEQIEPKAGRLDPKELVANLVPTLERLDNTVQLSWFTELAQTFFGWEGDRLTRDNWEALYDESARQMAEPGYTDRIIKQTNLEKVFLTNDFDDPLADFDTNFYVPCLRTDGLVFKLHTPEVRERLAKATGVEVGDVDSLRAAIRGLFENFTSKGARACAISLPPWFEPRMEPDDDHRLHALSLRIAFGDDDLRDRAIAASDDGGDGDFDDDAAWFGLVDDVEDYAAENLSHLVFRTLAEHCREFGLPFDLMIGVNRNVYPAGVHQGRDLYDSRCSLSQYADLFNAFPEVTFPVSVLAPTMNQELVSYAWIFPNVVTSGHWWYSNIPAHIAPDLRARLQAVPGDKQIGYYSDAYKLEFVLPKFAMYRRLLAKELAAEFCEGRGWSEERTVEFGLKVLRGNSERLFGG
ncbi:glucuronate isomerase [Alienimonas californiensis]|uniref:Glucuronate isomerase n=1 Tax=Alienimonas californiensis TaxID=2527989 RepID=A0A517PDR5_9PLAN|nr:glucuronate isomerase [Alienimonas californiensis]QDT17522.1 glucuronate isomerase [Alienimonas californiensis]